MLKRNNRAGQREASRFPVQLLASVLLGTALTVLLLAAFSKMLCTMDIPLNLILPISTLAACLAVLPAGMLFAFLRGEKGLVNGMILGAVFLGAIWAAALAQGQAEFSTPAALKSLVLLVSGAVGGYSGVLLKEKRRRIH